MTVFVANTNLLTLTGLKSQVEAEFINDATVAVTVTDKNGDEIDGSWPLTMDYVTDSDGDYRAVLADTLPLTARQTYVARITADGGSDRKGQWRFKFTPEIRR